jgi:hypothetical protein
MKALLSHRAGEAIGRLGARDARGKVVVMIE